MPEVSHGLPRERPDFRYLVIPLLCVALVALLFSISLVHYGSYDQFSNDAAQYVSTADQIRIGNGFKTTTLFYDVQLDQGMPAIQTVWPPVYPLLLAIAGEAFGLDTASAALLVNTIAHASSAILIFFAAVGLGARPVTGALAGIGYLVYWQAWTLCLSGLSEPVFTLFLLGSATSVTAAFRSQSPRIGLIALAVALVSLAFLVRFAALAYMAALGFTLLFLSWRSMPPRKAIATVLVAGVAMILVVTAQLGSNYLATGRLTGGPTSSGGHQLGELLRQFVDSATSLLGAGWGSAGKLTAIIMIVAVALGLGYRFTSQATGTLRGDRLAIVIFGVSGALLTVIMMSILTLSSSAYTLLDRFVVPTVPMLILAAVAFTTGPNADRSRKPSWLRMTGGIAVLAAVVQMLVNGAARFDELFTQGRISEMRTALAETIGNRPAAALLSEAASITSPILSNQSQALSLILRKPTVGIPSAAYTSRNWTSEDVVSQARRLGVRYICIFKKLPLEIDPREDFVLPLAEVPPSRAREVHRSSALILYWLED